MDFRIYIDYDQAFPFRYHILQVIMTMSSTLKKYIISKILYTSKFLCLLYIASHKMIVSLFLLVTVTLVVSQRDDWVEPHAWGGARRSSLLKASVKPSANCPNLECNCAATSDCPELSTVCPTAADCICPEAVDNHGEYLYRKLVKYIFNVKDTKVISYLTLRS